MLLKSYRRLLLQLLLVFSAFAIMVAVSIFFASEIVNKHISNYGDEVIKASAETIKTYLEGHEITLKDVAFDVEELWAQGNGAGEIKAELIQWSGWLLENDDRFDDLLFIYGYIDGVFIDALSWDYPDDFYPETRVWYTGAWERNGAAYYSDPYVDAYTGEYVMTISKQVFDADGEPFGVVALDVYISNISNYISHLQLMDSGYAVLLDSNRRIIVHPLADVLGMQIESVAGGSRYDEIAALLEAGEDISAFNYTSVLGDTDVAFFKELFNGWYLELSLSSKVYYKDVDQMRVSLTLAGAVLAILVGVVLTAMHIARVRSEDANKTKSSFLANMSHEIRTPMNAVIGMAELLLNEPLSERQAGYVRDINTSARSLLSIINDILDLSKIESGKLTLEPVNYDFHVLIDNIGSMFRFVAQKKGIEFRLESSGETPGVLFGDEVRLRQVLTNLCGNAVKFTDEGYVRLKVAASDGKLMFEVKDTGIGIHKEDMPKLFDAFVQAGADKNRNIAGTGLGLAICKSFVEMMGGKIMVDSEYGQGTIVTVMVPMVKGSESGVRHEAAKVSKPDLYAPYAGVLLVDDNEFNLKVAHGLLTMFGIDSHTAGSGKKAIQMVLKDDYDMVFMDHMMPDMDGIEAAGEIRKLGGKYKALPIVALTANAVQGARDMFLANGFNDYISKPIDIWELAGTLMEWLPPYKIVQRPDEAAADPADAGPAGLAGAGQAGPVLAEPAVSRNAGDATSAGEGAAASGDIEAAAAAEAGGPASAGVEDGETAWGDPGEIIDSIKEINTAIGLSHFAGMESMYVDNLRLFCRRLVPESERLAACLDDDDIDGFSISVHALKSTLATIGAIKLSEAALELEIASKNMDTDYCIEHFPGFNVELLKLHDALSAVFEG